MAHEFNYFICLCNMLARLRASVRVCLYVLDLAARSLNCPDAPLKSIRRHSHHLHGLMHGIRMQANEGSKTYTHAHECVLMSISAPGEACAYSLLCPRLWPWTASLPIADGHVRVPRAARQCLPSALQVSPFCLETRRKHCPGLPGLQMSRR